MEEKIERVKEDMSVRVSKSITASEARQLASCPDVLIRRIYKLIKDSATEGMIRLRYEFDSMTGKGLQEIKERLTGNGFNVKFSVWVYEDGIDDVLEEITDFTKDYECSIECLITW